MRNKNFNDKFNDANADIKHHRRYTNVNEYIAEFVKTLRDRFGLSQEALGELIDVSNVTVSNWENPGNDTMPSSENERRIFTLERRLSTSEKIQNSISELETPGTRAIKEMLLAGSDENAIELSEYLIDVLDLDEMSMVYHLLIASVVYAVISDQQTERGKELADKATNLLKEISISDFDKQYLFISLRNEVIGYHFSQIKNIKNTEELKSLCTAIIKELISLYDDSLKIGRKSPGLLWNALECASTCSLNVHQVMPILDKLYEAVDKNRPNTVRKRVMKDKEYKNIVPYLTISQLKKV